MSYRNRGIVLRAQMNLRDIIVVFISSSVFVYLLLIIEIVIGLMNRIFMYSAIKIIACGPVCDNCPIARSCVLDTAH